MRILPEKGSMLVAVRSTLTTRNIKATNTKQKTSRYCARIKLFCLLAWLLMLSVALL